MHAPILFADMFTGTSGAGPLWVGVIFLALASMAAGANQIDQFLRRRTGRSESERIISPQPLIVAEAARFVTKDESDIQMRDMRLRLDRVEMAIEALRRDAKEDRESIRQLVVDQVGSVHERINDLTGAVAGLRGAFDEAHKRGS